MPKDNSIQNGNDRDAAPNIGYDYSDREKTQIQDDNMKPAYQEGREWRPSDTENADQTVGEPQDEESG